jgi:uncharacterized membrane protein
MSDLAHTEPAARAGVTRGVLIRLAVTLAVIFGVIALSFGGRLDRVFAYMAAQPIQPHAPDLGLVAAASPVIQIHLYAALAALLVGAYLLTGRKGVMLHRVLGWGWVLLMIGAAVSSLFIRELNRGSFSFVHLLAGWTLIVAPLGLYFARSHQVLKHRKTMTGLFIGGLVIAGLLAFLPGRLLWRMFLG